MDGDVLLTGATGFLGREVLVRLGSKGASVRALVRAPDDARAQRRVDDALAERGGDEPRGDVRALAADLQAPRLGLPADRYDELAASTATIVHCAASVSFDQPLADARAINVEGTRRMLAFAERCSGLRRFCHVSTAYVAGDHRGAFGEDDLEVGQRFRNTYEQTKFEAERLVRRRRRRLPVQILRPSIVVGERGSGWTGSFNVLYTPLKLYARGALATVPGRAGAPVDVVPVDYVADAIAELCQGPESDNRTYHLVAGRDASTVGRLMALAARELGRPRPAAMPPALFRGVAEPMLRRRGGAGAQRVLGQASVFFPYFASRVRYDDVRARRRLRSAGIEVSCVDDYFPELVRYAELARWGREPVSLGDARVLRRPRRPRPAAHAR
ncbi:MAG TPA: SDR family oxidoreductase [Solirubrobacteraceae bacterium]|nr:SDR family oxidoreductase [Solirubrobacteraceae bacterium]